MIRNHLQPLLEWRSPGLSWHVPFLAALGVGIPVFLGVWSGQPRHAMLAATGAMVILYLPQAIPTIAGKMTRLVTCSAGFVVSYILGAASAFHPAVAIPLLGLLTLIATTLCRWNRVPPPGSFFFVVTASIACNARFNPLAIPANAGWIALGALTSCLLAFIYLIICSGGLRPSVTSARSALVLPATLHPSSPETTTPPRPDPVTHDPRLAAILVESAIIATSVALSLLAARLLHLQNPYWVPISCAAILQGGTFRAVWHRKVHRIVGTALGMGISWFLFPRIPDPLAMAITVTLLVFIVEFLVTRHYGLAVIFITPLTVCFAEFASGGVPIHDLFTARLIDITLGSLIGAAGGFLLHHPDWCRRMEAALKRLPLPALRET